MAIGKTFGFLLMKILDIQKKSLDLIFYVNNACPAVAI